MRRTMRPLNRYLQKSQRPGWRKVPNGVPDQIVRIVTENSQALKFTSLGFEVE